MSNETFYRYSNKQGFVETRNYYPYGLPHELPKVDKRAFEGKEMETAARLHWLDYGPRRYDHATTFWTSPDPLSAARPDISPYAYCAANPAANIDPSGLSTIYDRWGFHLGNSSEGFTGDILIYNGVQDPDFSNMTAEKIKREYSSEIFTYNGIKTDSGAGLYGYSHSRIWTHVVSQFEGQNFFGRTFALDEIPGGIIFNPNLNIENGNYTWTSSVSPYLGTLKYICGSGKFSYEPTVENIASSLIVHEWLTHGMLLYGDNTLTHRYSYAYVKSCTHLWDSTTDSYKKHNLSMLKHYSEKEPGNINYSKIYLEYYFGVLLNSIKNIWKK